MTVTANTTRNDYTAGSAQSEYDYTFQLNEAADVDVYLDGVKQTLNTHYVVQNVGNASGGTIVFTLEDENGDPIDPTEGAIINIVMAMDLDRDTNYQPSGAFLAADVNNDFDRLWLATNQQQTAVNRALRLKDTDVTTSSMELPLKDDRKGKLLAFNATTGDPEATTNNQSNWDTAYNNSITSASFSGSTLTLGQQDGGTITASHTPYLPIAGGTLTGDLRFNDNDELKFGDSNDLRIYHTGTSSIIQDAGTGDLALLGTNLAFANGAGTAYYAAGTEGGAFTLYYNGSEKLATTSGGISVTGTITATGYNDSNWNDAYNNMITAVDYTGSTLTLTQQDGGTLTTTINGGIGQWTTSDSNIYYNSGNVGIGTTSPRNQLTVGNTTDSADDQNATVGIKCDANHQGIMLQENSGAEQWSLGVNADGDLNFYDSQVTTPTVTFKDNGGVGIGTTSPAQPLHIVDGTDTPAIFESTDFNSRIEIRDSSGSSFVENRGGILALKADTDASAANSRIEFTVDNSEKMRITSSGNVGIGTTSPSYRLSIEQASPTLQLKTTNTTGTNTILFSDSVSNFVGNIKYNHSDNSLSFATTSTSNERMRINSSGNVGIGTTSPDEKLDVSRADVGNLAIFQTEDGTNNPRLTLSTTSTGVKARSAFSTGIAGSFEIEAAGGSSYISLNPNSSEAMRVKANGNVGIGTTSPASTLHVNGIITTTANPVIKKTVPVIEFRSPDGTSNGMNIKANLNNTDNYGLQFEDKDGNNRVVIDPDGDVSFYNDTDDTTPKFRWDASAERLGIGTSSPSEELHISASVPKARLQDSDGTNQYGEFYHSAGTTAISARNNTTDGTIVFQKNDGTTTDETMRIDSSGNVGIGTSSPSYKGHLEYTKTSDGTIGLRVEASATAYDGKVISWGEGTVENGVLGWADGFGLDSCYIASGIAGLRFQREFGSSPRIAPCNNSGVLSDNAIDLGASNARFDDIYATNTSIISSSDSTLKQDIEELTDAEERVAIACKGLLRKFRWISSVEEKGDDARIHFGIMAQDLRDAFTAEGLDAGRYGMFISDTWWEHEGEHYPTAESAPEGATEVTRLGVRYSELLAFIISAI